MGEQMELGPVDYLIVEWPTDAPPTGDAFPYLVDLVDRGIIRILDMSFIQKDEDGNVLEIGIADFDSDGYPDIAIFEGVSSGLLDEEDNEEAANAMEPGTAGAILLYENTWAAPFATALRNGGAQLVAQGRVPVNELVATLDELESDGI